MKRNTIVFSICWLLFSHTPVAAQQPPQCAVAATAPEVEIAKQVALLHQHRDIHNFATGAGITVAVIDTGIHPHPRLPEVLDGGNFIDDSPEGALHDCDAHGTVVAGIIAAQDTGDGIVGIAPGVRLLSLKQTSAKVHLDNSNNHGGTLASLTAAINSAVDQGAQVINTSVLSCIPPPTAENAGINVDTHDFNQAMHRAEAAGVVIVSAAGNINETCPAGSTVYPAHHETALGVAALTDPYTKTDYTLASPFPQASAPGSAFVGLSNTGDYLSHGITSNNGVTSYEGTSFAAPVVSGIVALLKQRHPQATAAEIRGLVYASVDPSSGAVDARRTLRYLEDAPVNHHQAIINPQPHTTRSEPQLRFIRGFYVLVVVAVIMGLVLALQNSVHNRIKRGNRP